MTAGLKNLEIISREGFFQDLTEKTQFLVNGMLDAAKQHQVPMTANQVGAMFGLFFTDQPSVQSFAAVSACDIDRFKRFFHTMLESGVYMAPSAYEAGFVSSAHVQSDLQATIDAAAGFFAKESGC